MNRRSTDDKKPDFDFASDEITYGAPDAKPTGNKQGHRAPKPPQRKNYTKKRRSGGGITGARQRRVRKMMW